MSNPSTTDSSTDSSTATGDATTRRDRAAAGVKQFLTVFAGFYFAALAVTVLLPTTADNGLVVAGLIATALAIAGTLGLAAFRELDTRTDAPVAHPGHPIATRWLQLAVTVFSVLAGLLLVEGAAIRDPLSVVLLSAGGLFLATGPTLTITIVDAVSDHASG